jgi:hypothetical protein
MNDGVGPILATDLRMMVDYGQIYIYSPAVHAAAATDANLDALEDATRSGRFVGVAEGVVDLITPGQWNSHTPVRVEVWPDEPPATEDSWDHEVDVDLDVPDGELVFEGPTCEPVTIQVPAGRYRARMSGRGFTALGGSGANGDDSYRVRLWPRITDTEPRLRRSWPGWADYR